MKLIGHWFTTSIALSFGDTRYVLRVDQGRIGDIVTNPGIDARAAFGFRAPVALEDVAGNNTHSKETIQEVGPVGSSAPNHNCKRNNSVPSRCAGTTASVAASFASLGRPREGGG
jgi:hypothetical protein